VAGVSLAVGGLALLGGGPDVGTGRGELLTLGCALAFAVHLLVLADAAPRFPVAALSAVQFAVVAAVLVVPGALAGGYDLDGGAWAAAAYTGVAVTAGGLGLQAWGQRRVSPTRAALLLLIEPVSAAVLGFLAGERLGAAGAAGALLILAGILVSELGVPVTPRPEDA
jgi:drug/metabolite transporter (DMT)-like permease